MQKALVRFIEQDRAKARAYASAGLCSGLRSLARNPGAEPRAAAQRRCQRRAGGAAQRRHRQPLRTNAPSVPPRRGGVGWGRVGRGGGEGGSISDDV